MSNERKERFTPGPWITDGKFAGNTLEDYVAMVVGDSKEERIANAALIASAPEMYALLAEIDGLPVADVSGPMKDVLACVDFRGRVNAALKKARGGHE